MTRTASRYQAHCIWCGRDAYRDAWKAGRCPRCGATLLLELDLERSAPAVREGGRAEVLVRARNPRRRPLADRLDLALRRDRRSAQ